MALFFNLQLYAIGGFDGENRLNSIECYHPENNEWTTMAPMKFSRSGAGVAVLNQYIYVVGGFDGSRQLSSVERFDTDQETWETVTPMKTSRSALSVNVIDGKLYAMVSLNEEICMNNAYLNDGFLSRFRVDMMEHIFLQMLKCTTPSKICGKREYH